MIEGSQVSRGPEEMWPRGHRGQEDLREGPACVCVCHMCLPGSLLMEVSRVGRSPASGTRLLWILPVSACDVTLAKLLHPSSVPLL